jgi:hypothetical protein
MATNLKQTAKLVEMQVKERRSSVRYPFTAAADVVDMEAAARLSARTSDLGRGGCFIDTVSTFPVGTTVSLRVTSEGKSFEGRARVVYEAVGMGMGLAFTAVEPDQLWVLEKWLGRLSGELPPELDEPETGATFTHEPVHEASRSAEPGFVLNELIITLVRKRVLSESEGKQLLQKLVR